MIDKELEKYIKNNYKGWKQDWIMYQIVKLMKDCDEIVLVKLNDNVMIKFMNDEYVDTFKEVDENE